MNEKVKQFSMVIIVALSGTCFITRVNADNEPVWELTVVTETTNTEGHKIINNVPKDGRDITFELEVTEGDEPVRKNETIKEGPIYIWRNEGGRSAPFEITPESGKGKQSRHVTIRFTGYLPDEDGYGEPCYGGVKDVDVSVEVKFVMEHKETGETTTITVYNGSINIHAHFGQWVESNQYNPDPTPKPSNYHHVHYTTWRAGMDDDNFVMNEIGEGDLYNQEHGGHAQSSFGLSPGSGMFFSNTKAQHERWMVEREQSRLKDHNETEDIWAEAKIDPCMKGRVIEWKGCPDPPENDTPLPYTSVRYEGRAGYVVAFNANNYNLSKGWGLVPLPSQGTAGGFAKASCSVEENFLVTDDDFKVSVNNAGTMAYVEGTDDNVTGNISLSLTGPSVGFSWDEGSNIMYASEVGKETEEHKSYTVNFGDENHRYVLTTNIDGYSMSKTWNYASNGTGASLVMIIMKGS